LQASGPCRSSYTGLFKFAHEASRCPIARPSAATLIIDAHVPHRRRNGSSARPISRAICAANERGFDMKIDPRGRRAGRAQDPRSRRLTPSRTKHAVRQLLGGRPTQFCAAASPACRLTSSRRFFAGAVPEDLVHYQACEDRQKIAGGNVAVPWRAASRKLPRSGSARRTPPRVSASNDVSIVEIINDDMPFSGRFRHGGN